MSLIHTPPKPPNPIIGNALRTTLGNCTMILRLLTETASQDDSDTPQPGERSRERLLAMVGQALDYEIRRVEALSAQDRLVKRERQLRAGKETS